MKEFVEKRFSKVSGGAVATPLLILFFLYFFDEFDTAAFANLAPEIKKAFGLSNSGFAGIVFLNLLLLLVLAIPIGYYADRIPRTKIVVAGAVLAGTFSLVTGVAPTLLVLVLARIGNGIGVVINDPVHRSLLSDYYRPDVRPQVYATHANAQRWGAIFGAAVTGALAVLIGWRYTFAILIIPVLLMAFAATKLRDPTRGESDDAFSAELAAQEKSVPFGRGVRILLGVRTLKLQFAAWVGIGAGFLPLAIFVPLFLEKQFGLGPFSRGLIVSIGVGIQLLSVKWAGSLTRKWLAEGMGVPIRYAGLSLVAVGPCVLVVGIAGHLDNLPLAVGAIFTSYFVGGFFTPPFLTTQALVSPARVRSLSFSFGALFLGVGLLVYLVLFGAIANHSEANAIMATAPFWVIGGLVLASANRHVANDTTRAFAILTAAAEMHQERQRTGDRSILSVRGIDVSYGPVQILFGVDFELAEGEMVALLGTNGAGKSTLLRAISGLVPLQGGAIFFDGDEISGLDPEDTFAAGLIQVPGGRGIFPGLTVRENLEVAMWATRRPKSEAKGAIDEILTQFPNLGRRLDQPAGVLSGGEQQMLTLGQAFIAKPKLLMIDELSLGLAPIIVEELLQVVRRVHQEGTSVILVEQSVNVALTVADRAVFMEKGEVRFSGPTADLLHRDDILRAVFLGGAAAAEGMLS